jgi:hypothetical protein
MQFKVKLQGLFSTGLLFLSFAVVAQNLNMTRTWAPNKPFTNEADVISPARTISEVIQTSEYIDGYGRPVQTNVKNMSPTGQDVFDIHIYDANGFETKKYLPFASGNSGNNIAGTSLALTIQNAFNQTLYPGETNFYSEVTLENSPLSRTLNSYMPGNSWVGSLKGSSVLNLINTAADNVQIWNIAAAQGSIPTTTGAYQAGQLYKTIAKDINNLQTIVYKDKEEHVVLKKIQVTAAADAGNGSLHNGWLCTYYVYDDYGNMRFMITPKVVALIDGIWIISPAIADELCYRYEYDLLNRAIINKSPGAGEEWSVYDQRNRLVMSQDANQRLQQKWTYFQYDNQDRPIATGLMNDPVNYNNLTYHQSNAFVASVNPSYPNIASYTTELLSQTYYDNYNWVGGTGSGLSSALDQSNVSNTTYFYSPSNSTFPYAQPLVQTVMNRGLVTGSKREVLGSGGSQYLYAVNFYDDKGRTIQTQGTNITGAIDKTTTQYSWTGTEMRILEQHNKNGSPSQSHNMLTKMNYDFSGRLQDVKKTISSIINTAPVTTISSPEKTIATYSYNELGQVKNKTLGVHPTFGGPIETLTYDYNVHGWLTGINKNFTQQSNNGNYFGMELAYDKITSVNGTTTFTNPAYNGNVAGQIWKTKGDGVPRKYDYTYDNANQLINANFVQNTSQSGSTWDKTYIDYSVNNITYDLNGNIKSLNQNGFVLGGATPNIDNLNYNYLNTDNSNRLMNVIDNANNPQSKIGDFHYAVSKTINSVDYGYDGNGNQTSDVNKSISSITYNLLNLPSVITVAGKGTITFTYDAVGNKLKKITQENNATVPYNGTNYTTDITTITSYIGGYLYQSKVYSNPSLSALNIAEALQSVDHEEGRARIVYPLYGQPAYFAFDYFVKDNLGNIRVTVTDEKQDDTYPAATLEPAGVATEQAFYNILNDVNHIIPTSTLPWFASASGSGYSNGNGLPVPPDPTVNPGGTNTKLYKLAGGINGDKFGMGIALKVMAGDNINIFARSVWHNNGQPTDNNSYNISTVLSSFINAFAGTSSVASGSHGTATGTVLNGNPTTTGNLTTLLNNVPTPASGLNQPPKAYINWILFDEQFKPVQSGSSFDMVNLTPDVVKPHGLTGIPIVKSGYLYVYCSNESNQDVYFDNLQVQHLRGQLLQEKSYYPGGLAMYALNSRAYGKLQNNFGYQGKEMQSGESMMVLV